MERKIEKVIMLYQHSSNPINYWADMSKYKGWKLEWLQADGTRLKNDQGTGGPEGKQGKTADVKRQAEMNTDSFIYLFFT